MLQNLSVQQEFWKSIARMAMHQAWEKYTAPQVSIRLAPRAVIVNKADIDPDALQGPMGTESSQTSFYCTSAAKTHDSDPKLSSQSL